LEIFLIRVFAKGADFSYELDRYGFFGEIAEDYKKVASAAGSWHCNNCRV
jgi:hypothetical protein